MNINKNEIQKVINCGIISEEYIHECIEKMKKQEILNMHTYKITQSKDGKWRTYVKDPSKPSGCRLIKKSTEEKIYEELSKFYENKCHYTFKMAYENWRKVQDQLVSDNTVARYNTDYIRCFKGTKFEKMFIENITTDDIKIFFHDIIEKKGLKKEGFKKVFGYVNNVFIKAYREKIINENPMSYLVCKQFYRYCIEIDKPIEKQIFNPEEEKQIINLLHIEYEKKPLYMPNYAVEFASLTGMRVGEISALKWDCVFFDKGYFLIDKSEKFNRLTHEYFIDETKNKKKRIFPIDDRIKNLLSEIRKKQIKFGFSSEWVFANEDSSRIHTSVISSCIKNKCKMIGIPQRGIHSFRKTLNSNMRCAGVSSVVASALLGHSPDVNRDYYTFDISTLDEKTNIIKKVHEA